MIQELFKLILICSIFVDIFCYNIKTEWCSVDKNTKGRCRPQEDCFNATAVENSDCNKEETVCCPEVTEAYKMCKTFGESLYNQDNSVAVGFNTNKTDTETLTCASAETPLIIGGEKAREKEFPYMAAIGYGKTVKDAKWHCGGTLITEYFVLSAAHCIKSKPLKSPAKWALLGILDLTKEDEPGRQLFDIVKRIKHPKYIPPSKEYDIMLFKLSSPAKLNEFVHPACLNMDDTINTVNVFATGWGVTSLAETSNSDILMKVTLQIRGYDECTTAYEGQSKSHLPHGLKDSMLCVGFPEGGKDTCQGDSGGPITIGLKDPKCMYSIVGVTSFGLFCGFSVPAVYTRVSYFVPWIMNEITKEK